MDEGVNFPEKKCYVTLDWPLMATYVLSGGWLYLFFTLHTAQDVSRAHRERPAAARLLLEVCSDSHGLPSQLQVQRHRHDAALDLVQGHGDGTDGRQRDERAVETKRNVVS